MIAKIRNSFFSRVMSLVLLTQMILPSQAWALTGGPSQPEFTSFTPVGVTDMVDLFTGDFQYNIPLLDIEGYPVNLSYSAGIGMEDQASCVGLGWTLNAAGIINRTVRGIPDDFNGDDEIVTTTNLRTNWTVGANVSVKPEVVGKEIISSGLDFGVFYNNYTGVGYDITYNMNPTILSSDKFKGSMNLGLGLSANSESGIGIKPYLGLNYAQGKTIGDETGIFSGSLGIGTSYNSRGGLRQVTIGGSVSNTHKTLQRDDNGNVIKDKNGNDAYKSKTKGLNGSTVIPVGTSTYVPQISLPMSSSSVDVNVGTGLEVPFIWSNAQIELGGYFSRQALFQKNKKSPAFGYLYAEKGNDNRLAMHDFNREKDGGFTKNTPALPMTQMTYDLYSVTGQGVSGMFRPYRDFATVFDPRVYSSSDGGSFGVDLGAGGVFKGGINMSYNTNISTSGMWSSGDKFKEDLSFNEKDETNVNNIAYEKVYFKNAGEFSTIDNDYYKKIQEIYPVRIDITSDGIANKTYKKRTSLSNFTETDISIPGNIRKSRDKRNQPMSYLTAEEAIAAGLEKKMYSYEKDKNNKDVVRDILRTQDGRKAHHLSEITITRTDGVRYVYGSQTYNYKQQEVTFNASSPNATDRVNGLVGYKAGEDNSTSNKNGIDHYYNCNELPPHATAYQLTAILSPDYVDVKDDGPTTDDLGNYTKFNYTQFYSQEKGNAYKWRNPYYENKANYQEGFKCKDSDDKGTYLYGEKEIKMLHSIETKNYIAIFYYSYRNDAWDVKGKDGGKGDKRLFKLDEIKLYSRYEQQQKGDNAVPIKTVHFEYDYSLCKNEFYFNPDNTSEEGGKLTLTKVYFTYGNSKKGMLSPYQFEYKGLNPVYDPRAQDRWGVYKPNSGTLSNLDAPYVTQNGETDKYAAAWSLTSIQLPSGGLINVKYESDDYAFVQDKRAANMIKIKGFGSSPGGSINTGLLYDRDFIGYKSNSYIYFDAPAEDVNDFRRKYIGTGDDEIKELFFKCYTNLSTNSSLLGSENYEYIIGYAKIAGTGWRENDKVGWIKLKEVDLDDNGLDGDFNPIAKTAMQYVRLNMPDLYYGIKTDNNMKDPGMAAVRFIASTILDIQKMMKGANNLMCERNMCVKVETSKSFIRLKTANNKKRGGGLRVKELTINDNWTSMSDNKVQDSEYGQVYEYTRIADGSEPGIPDGTKISSGVASYEPFIGNEENALRSSDAYTDKQRLAPDNRFYLEKPYGEMFYPTPSVGYSRVVVKNKVPLYVKRTGTGYTEHEFYTAKDFPVIIREPYFVKEADKGNNRFWRKLFKVDVIDNMTVSQSYAIELNNMHGKPKAERSYGEGQNIPTSEVEYYYKTQSSNQLANEITAIYKDGTVRNNVLAGIDIDMTADERESKTSTDGLFIPGDLDISTLPPPFAIPIPLPSSWPRVTSESTRFRSVTNTKVITRYGILEEVRAKDLGAETRTKNLAWDAETGEVLLTQVKNNFGDDVYSFTYPAHWGYEGMAQTYKNIGLSHHFDFSNFNNAKLFVPGDELYVKDKGRGWVTEVFNNSITVVDENGGQITGINDVIVIRSGRRNQQTVPIGSIVSLENPVVGNELVFKKVLNAGAVEFGAAWGNFCEQCISKSTNPYITGKEGNYRPLRSFLYLTERTQSDYNRNTNIRKDGTYVSFSPFWVKNGGKDWKTQKSDWTFASEVTMFSPYGFEMENRDALGRYTAADYGYNNTLPICISGNAQYQEIGFTGFEDANMNDCKETHFIFNDNLGNVSDKHAHTGSYSIQVKKKEKVELEKILVPCGE